MGSPDVVTVSDTLSLETESATDSLAITVDLTAASQIRWPGLPDTIALSPSRTNDFLTCPLLFRLRGIDRVVERPTSPAARGTLVHEVLDRLFGLPAQQRTLPVANQLIEPAWQAMLDVDPSFSFALVESPFDPDRPPTVPEDVVAAWLKPARPLLKKYFELEDPRRLQPVARELKLDVTVDDGLALRGIIDRVDQIDDRVRLSDYKTGRSPGAGFEQKAMFQMRFYALLWLRTNGVVPELLQLLYLGDGEVLSYQPSHEDLTMFEAKLQAIWRTVRQIAESGDWQARQSSACRSCQHHAMCPAQGGQLPPLPSDFASGV